MTPSLVNTPSYDTAQALHTRVDDAARALGSATQLYALVEPGLLDGLAAPVPMALAQVFAFPGRASLYAARREALAASIGPMVVQPDADQAAWLWQYAQPLHAVSWFWTEAPREALAARLAQGLDAQTDDGLGFLLRYYDPRQAEPMLRLMGPEAVAALLEPGEVWAWVDPWQRACTVRGGTSHETAHEMTRLPGARALPVFDEPAMAAIMRLCEPGPLAQALQQRVPGLLAPWAQPSAYALASHLCRVAAAHGLEVYAQQLSFALDALDLHPMVHTHPVVVDRVAAGARLDEVLAALSEDERASIAQTLRSRAPPETFTAPLGYATGARGEVDDPGQRPVGYASGRGQPGRATHP